MSQASTAPRVNRNPKIRAMSPDERSQYFREIGRRSNAERLVLSIDERAALADAYALLGKIAARHGLPGRKEADTV